MTEHDDYIYLKHIAGTSGLLQRTARLGKEKFLSDADVRDATIYRLQTLAESAQRLSTEFKIAHPEVPWADVARFRNRAVHGYLGVDLEIIWTLSSETSPVFLVSWEWRWNAATSGQDSGTSRTNARSAVLDSR